jgi:hypothetical protein
MNYRLTHGKTILQAFEDFHKKNPEVYKQFENQTLSAIAKGRNKISAKLIINWIRWNIYLDTTDESYKINDAFQSYYARLFVALHPQHLTIFNFRKLRNEENGF